MGWECSGTQNLSESGQKGRRPRTQVKPWWRFEVKQEEVGSGAPGQDLGGRESSPSPKGLQVDHR